MTSCSAAIGILSFRDPDNTFRPAGWVTEPFLGGTEMPEPLKVLFIATEAIPFTHPGGLSDVVGALPGALRRQGVDARIIMPFYRSIRKGFATTLVARDLDAPLGATQLRFDVRETHNDDVPVWFVDREDLYDRPHLYGDHHGDYYDNLERFAFFCHAALRAVEALGFRPDVIHGHDWQTGLVPALLKGPFRRVARLQGVPTVFTFHDLRYQGIFPREKLPLTGLSDWEFFHADGLEYWGQASLLKAGLVYAEAVTTTSPAYAREVVQPGGGQGMEGVIHKRRDDLAGILNGVDYAGSNPSEDDAIAASFDAANLTNRVVCRRDLLSRAGLGIERAELPIVGMATPLQRAKGIDLLLESVDRLMEEDLNLVVHGTGDPSYQARLVQASRRHPGRMAVVFSLDEPDIRRLIAGADILLLPARQKPCGATQMHALRYGAVPVAMATGGLQDAIQEYDPEHDTGTGFKFQDWRADDLIAAVRRALAVFRDHPEAWRALQARGMAARFTWDQTAAAYLQVYQSLVR